MILEGHANQYDMHSQLSKYREGNNIVNIIAIANFHLGSFMNLTYEQSKMHYCLTLQCHVGSHNYLQGCSESTLQSQHAACPGQGDVGPAGMRHRIECLQWSHSQPLGR